MIPLPEFREIARQWGVPESTVERDYAQNWFLNALYDNTSELVLKGGTGIRKIHIPNYRFSDDLDFGLLRQMDQTDIRSLIKKSNKQAREESGIQFQDTISLKDNVNGFEGSVYFRILRRAGSPHKIKLDITEYKAEVMIYPTELLSIIHPFSDAISRNIITYSLKEIFVEKIRALFQRTRPRDLYDVWFLSDTIALSDLHGPIIQKCEFKGIKPDLNEFKQRTEYFRSSWHSSLKHQMKDLPDFQDALTKVMSILEMTISIVACRDLQ